MGEWAPRAGSGESAQLPGVGGERRLAEVPKVSDWGADAFEVLGLAYDPDLTDEQVRRAYVERMRVVHPDAGGDVVCAAAVSAAFMALRSGVLRGELLAGMAGLTEAPVDEPVEGAVVRRRWWEGPRSGAAPVGAAPGGKPDAVERERLRRRVAVLRAEQGLPPVITDQATLERIAELLVAVLGGDAVPRPRPGGSGDERRAHAAAGREARRPVVGPGWFGRWWMRFRRGRPVVLGARVGVAVLVPVVGYAVAPGFPAWPGLLVGSVTWLVLTGRWDVAPGGRR